MRRRRSAIQRYAGVTRVVAAQRGAQVLGEAPAEFLHGRRQPAGGQRIEQPIGRQGQRLAAVQRPAGRGEETFRDVGGGGGLGQEAFDGLAPVTTATNLPTPAAVQAS